MTAVIKDIGSPAAFQPRQQRVLAGLALAVAALGLGFALGVLPPDLVAIGMVAMIVLAVALTSPVWALGIILLSLPLELFVVSLGPIGLAPVQIISIFVVALVLASAVTRGRHVVPRTPLDVAMLAWIAVSFIGAVEALDPAAAIKKAGMTAIFVGIFYASALYGRKVGKAQLLLVLFTVAATIIAIYAVWISYQYLAVGTVVRGAVIIGSEGLKTPRAGGTFGNPSTLAALMTLAIPIAAGLLVAAKWRMKPLLVAALAILLVCLGFTFTRGAWLGTALGLVVLGLSRRARPTVLIIAVVLAFAAPGPILSRVAQSTQFERGEISSRFDFWEASLHIAEQRPLFGVGINNFPPSFARLPVAETSNRIAIHAHNVFLTVLAENGAVGLVVFCLLMGTVLAVAWRAYRESSDEGARLYELAIAAAIIAYLGHQMTDSMLLEPSLNAVMYVLMGLVVGLAAEYRPASADRAVGRPAVAGGVA